MVGVGTLRQNYSQQRQTIFNTITQRQNYSQFNNSTTKLSQSTTQQQNYVSYKFVNLSYQFVKLSPAQCDSDLLIVFPVTMVEVDVVNPALGLIYWLVNMDTA